QFFHGLIAVKAGEKWGYADKTGKEVILPKYEKALPFNSEYTKVMVNHKWGLIDKTGKEIIPMEYDDIDSRRYFGFFIVEINHKRGLVNSSGKEVIPVKYDELKFYILENDSEPLFEAKLDKKIGLIDAVRGRELIPVKYTKIEHFTDNYNRLYAQVWNAGKLGLVDRNGEEVIPAVYDKIGKFFKGFTEGPAPVKLNGKYGFIEAGGKEVIPFKYDDAWGFINGKARVQINKKGFYINKKGEKVK